MSKRISDNGQKTEIDHPLSRCRCSNIHVAIAPLKVGDLRRYDKLLSIGTPSLKYLMFTRKKATNETLVSNSDLLLVSHSNIASVRLTLTYYIIHRLASDFQTRCSSFSLCISWCISTILWYSFSFS